MLSLEIIDELDDLQKRLTNLVMSLERAKRGHDWALVATVARKLRELL